MRYPWLFVALMACGPTAPSAASPSASGGEACRAQDARDNGTDCTDIFGFTFVGDRCLGITYGCEGTDCGDVEKTKAACEARFARCL